MSGVTYLEAESAITGLAGALLLASGARWAAFGWLAFLGSNVAGIAFAAFTGHYWLLAQQIGFTCTSLLGVWNWIIKPLRAARQGKGTR
jgi:hypothetical protein